MIILRFLQLLISCLLLATLAVAQENTGDPLQKANEYFEQQDYARALDLYLSVSHQNMENPLLKYKIGICYYNSDNHKRKAIGYLEFAKNYKDERIPADVYYFLGRCYHLSYRFIDAINMLNVYQDELEKQGQDDPFPDTQRIIEMCQNGAQLIKNPINTVSVQILDYPVNTSYDDYAPLVSNDGRMLIFSSSRPQNSVHWVHGDKYTFLPPNLQSNTEAVHMATRRGIDWSFPYTQDIVGKKIETLSISSDNSMMLLCISEAGEEGELYISSRKRGRWASPKKISGKINSRYTERGACFSDAGNSIYFSSNRPGGFGGFDIYRAKKTGKNEWGDPENLGATINTEADEVNPFVHPDTQNLYFSSNGHNSIGGLDIFHAKRDSSQQWLAPSNLGYPINSTFDDDYFTQIPDGQYAYLSSNRIENKSFGKNDIISVFKPQKKLPLTMLKGVIRVKEGNKYLPVSLKVFDSETNKEQPYVYNPDSETGNYFVIVRPNRHYAISIQVDGNEVNRAYVDIPEKTYNYEFNQSLIIDSFKLFGQSIGSAIKVDSSGTSYEIAKLSQIEAAETGTEYRYDAMILLMEQLIATVDYEGWARLNELEEEDIYDNPQDFGDTEVDYWQKLYERVNFAFESANAEILRDLQGPQLEGSKVVLYGASDSEGRKVITTYPLPFAAGASRLGRNHIQNLQELASFLLTMPNVNAEINAYARNPEQQQANYDKILSEIQAVMLDKDIPSSQFPFSSLEVADKSKVAANSLLIEIVVFETSTN